MPEAMTHYYFACDLLGRLEKKYLNQMNFNEARVFLYANFYDLPYYFRFTRLLKKNSFNLGYKLHNTNTKEFIEEIINYIRNDGYDKDNVLMLYCLVSHYVLDLTIHPFIYSRSGLYKINQKETYAYRGNHGLLERAIDHELTNRRENLSLGNIKLTKKFKGAFIFNFSDLELINHSIKAIYFFPKAEDYFRISLRKLKYFMRFTSHDFLNIKKILLKLNDLTLNRKSSVVTSNFLYKKKYANLDYLNEDHKIWVNPVTNDASNLSFMELYDIALRTGDEYFNAVSNYLFYNNSKQFKLLFNGASLDTGCVFDSSQMVYDSPIFPTKKKK